MTITEVFLSHDVSPVSGAGAGPSGNRLSRTTRLSWIIPVVIIVVDQATKWLVAGSMTLYQSIPVLGDWFRLTYIHNPGGAFGVRWGHQGMYFAAALLVIIWIAWHLWKHGQPFQLSTLALALILGGAVGNLIDRTILGEVIDFLDFDFPDMRVPSFDFGFVSHVGSDMDRWPTFNVADSAVTVGVLMLVVSLVYDPILRHTKWRPVSPAGVEGDVADNSQAIG